MTTWLSPGRHTFVGYLCVSRGHRKKRYGLLDGVVADALERAGHTFARYQDLHSVWRDRDISARPGHQMQRPFARYRKTQPIPGLQSTCDGHRVEITATVGEPWDNGLGAYITRATGRCLDCPAAAPGTQ